jgi:hypothetical protein
MGRGTSQMDEGDERDEIELRVEGLRAPSSPSHASGDPFSGRRDRFRVVRRALYALALVVVIVSFALAPGGSLGSALDGLSSISAPPAGSRAPALAAAYPTPTLTPIPTRVAYPTPTLPQGTPATLGPAPASCSPVAPAPRTLPATFSGAIGASPLWVAWFDGPHATRHIEGLGGNSRYGWEIAAIFAIEPGFAQAVVVRGVRLDDGSPLWFGHAAPTVAVVLDSRQPGLTSDDNRSMGLRDDWAAWYTILSIPAAGCYALTATWPGGSWRVTFAAGR